MAKTLIIFSWIFSKVFDKLDYSILAKKLVKKKVLGKVGTWLMIFVSGRSHKLWANDELSY